MARDRVHTELWRTFAQERDQDHRRKEKQLGSRISQLEQELRDRPVKTEVRYIDAEELEHAQAEAERAFRSRENAWQALCEIRLIHREGETGRCRCGLRLDRCGIAQIVDRYPGLERWEAEQYRRLRNGESHSLPDGHPAILDQRWRP